MVLSKGLRDCPKRASSLPCENNYKREQNKQKFNSGELWLSLNEKQNKKLKSKSQITTATHTVCPDIKKTTQKKDKDKRKTEKSNKKTKLPKVELSFIITRPGKIKFQSQLTSFCINL